MCSGRSPGFSALTRHLAAHRIEGGDVDAALRDFERNYELHSDHTGVAGSLGEAYWKAGQPEKGIELLERAVELDPSNDHRAGMLEEFRREMAGEDT